MTLTRPEIREAIGCILAQHMDAAFTEAALRKTTLYETSSLTVMVWALEELIVAGGDAEEAGVSGMTKGD